MNALAKRAFLALVAIATLAISGCGPNSSAAAHAGANTSPTSATADSKPGAISDADVASLLDELRQGRAQAREGGLLGHTGTADLAPPADAKFVCRGDGLVVFSGTVSGDFLGFVVWLPERKWAGGAMTSVNPLCSPSDPHYSDGGWKSSGNTLSASDIKQRIVAIEAGDVHGDTDGHTFTDVRFMCQTSENAVFSAYQEGGGFIDIATNLDGGDAKVDNFSFLCD